MVMSQFQVPERDESIILWHGKCLFPQTSVTSENLESSANDAAEDKSSQREGVLLSNSFLASLAVGSLPPVNRSE